MAIFIPAPKPAIKEEEPKFEKAQEGAYFNPQPHIENLTMMVTLEGPEMASKAFHVGARLLETEYQKNPIDYEITLLGITRTMNANNNVPRWEYRYNFVAVKRA